MAAFPRAAGVPSRAYRSSPGPEMSRSVRQPDVRRYQRGDGGPFDNCILQFSRSTRPAAGHRPTRSVATSSLLESPRCPDRPCSSHRRSGGAPEPRQDRLPQCRVHAESSGARNHLDLLPDDLGKADRPWPRAADLEQLPGPPASNLDDETLPRDASGVRVATDPRLGEVDLGNLAQRRCRRLAVDFEEEAS